MRKAIIIITTIVSIGCNSPTDKEKELTKRADVAKTEDSSSPVTEMSIGDQDDEGWGADIRLSIGEIIRSDTSVVYKVKSLYKMKSIGFDLSLPTAKPQNENALAQILTIKSSGEISDNFLKVLSELYKQEIDSTKRFIKSARIAFIDLNEFSKRQFGKEPVNKSEAKEIKIFFEGNTSDYYAELYLNINEKEHWLELKEKDESYRDQVIKFLATR